MQTKALRERPEIAKVIGQGSRMGLIDSGASSCLRQARGEEPAGLVRRVVDLAQGSAELFVTSCGTLVSTEPVETIVALGSLIKLGCRLQWNEAECILWHPSRGRIRLNVQSGCPRIAEQLALELIDEVERYRIDTVVAATKALHARDAKLLPPPEEAISDLTQALICDHGVPEALGQAVMSLWPRTPDGILQDLTCWSQRDNGSLVSNRRKRRAVDRAKKVQNHLFAGESRKEVERRGAAKGYEVISVGVEEDITSPQTFACLARLAAFGKVDVWLGAPPCGTNSLCRFIRPGPRPLCGRDNEARWGRPDLTDGEKAKVKYADELYLRTLLLMHIGQEGNARINKEAPWDLIENPQDPETYVSPESELWKLSRDHGGFPSFFATEEYQASAQLLGLMLYNGDQGP